MLPTSKWIEGLDAEGSVADAAKGSLYARLTAVAYALPLAAHLAEHDIEHVHRLRVSTRRATAALQLYRDWLPGKPYRWIKKRLKMIRRAAGEARDLDVLGHRLEEEYGDRAEGVVDSIKEARARVQPDIVAISKRCRRSDHLVRKTRKLLIGISAPDDQNGAAVLWRDWAAERLAATTAAFLADMPGESADTEELHQFRIRGKALRYTIELLASAFGEELRTKQYRIVEALQERLGDVQDHVAAIARLQAWSEESDDNERRAALGEMIDEERSHLADAIIAFREWWTEERVATLREGLTRAAASDAADDTHRPQVAHQT